MQNIHYSVHKGDTSTDTSAKLLNQLLFSLPATLQRTKRRTYNVYRGWMDGLFSLLTFKKLMFSLDSQLSIWQHLHMEPKGATHWWRIWGWGVKLTLVMSQGRSSSVRQSCDWPWPQDPPHVIHWKTESACLSPKQSGTHTVSWMQDCYVSINI